MSDSVLASIVVPVYNEAEALPELIRELSTLESNQWGDAFEFVLVDDASTDHSWEVLEKWAENEPRVTLAGLAGNRGPARAARVGFEIAEGDVIIPLPADLQEGVDLVQECLEKWHANHRIVMMVPKTERVYESRLDSLFAAAFYTVLKLNSRVYGDLSVRAIVKLLDRFTAKSFCRLTSDSISRTAFALRSNLPYDVVVYDVKARVKGRSKWTFRKRLLLMLDLFVDTAAWLLSPWRIALLGGALYAILRSAAAAFTSMRPALMTAADICLAGFVLLMLSILGIYVTRIHQEVRGGTPCLIKRLRRGAINAERKARAELSEADPVGAGRRSLPGSAG